MSDKKELGIILDEKGKPSETTAYKQWMTYRDHFLIPGGVIEALKERRRFFRGDHYTKGYANNAPKPTLNLVQEGVVKIAAKITSTKRHVTFIADKENEDLDSLARFYEHQTIKMKRELTIADATMIALIDGTGVLFTSFDSDTIGTEGLYKGFLKDKIVPFEETFWSNPWTDDPQDMRYCGYYIDMEIGAAKELIEGSEKIKKLKSRYVATENYFMGEAPYEFDKITDSDLTKVFVRFFRKDGEVYFEVATQYVTLTEHPHALNPKITEKRLKQAKESEAENENVKNDVMVKDFDTDNGKYVMYTDPSKQSHSSHMREKRKFYRYPVAVCIPYPEIPHRCILGRSLAAAIIPNQKLYNYCYLLVTLIMQYHAMPKWLSKPNALGTQKIDNTPNQILYDYSSIQENGGGGWGLTRIGSGEAINSDLLQIGDTIAANTRFILGFANLEANGSNIDSGYEYMQRMKQVNLPLEVPQQHVWNFCTELATTDLMYFMHYIDHAKFYTIRSDSEIALNENYRKMEQDLINNGKSQVYKRGTILPKSRRYEIKEIDQSFFDAEFDVAIEVEQGIAGSELTESQHYNQIWTYVAQGNLTADKIKFLVDGDPAISRNTRARLQAGMEELETSQLALKDQQIQALQQAINELQTYMKFSQQVIQHQQAKQKATEKAAMDQNRVASELIKSSQEEAASKMSESEVKSLNAKGISGGSFAGGGNDTIYNTGA